MLPGHEAVEVLKCYVSQCHDGIVKVGFFWLVGGELGLQVELEVLRYIDFGKICEGVRDIGQIDLRRA